MLMTLCVVFLAHDRHKYRLLVRPSFLASSFLFRPDFLQPVWRAQETSMVNTSVHKSKNGTILFEPFIVYRIHR